MLSNSSPSPVGGREAHSLHSCPLCQAAYNPLKTLILAERDDEHLLFLECRQCGAGVMAIVSAGADGLTITGTLTDLTSSEIYSLTDQRPISADDVIAMHQWLAQEERLLIALRQ